MSEYKYLKPFMRSEYPKDTILEIGKSNVFYPISPEDIYIQKKKMGITFPPQLRNFYVKIGFGHLTNSHELNGHDSYLTNLILHPNSVACFYSGQLYDDFEQYYMSESFYEMMQPGDLPFFEIFDSSKYLIMKPYSDTPNAVWSVGNIKIEDSFEKFIWRLYYENPSFYDDIIEDFYKKMGG